MPTICIMILFIMHCTNALVILLGAQISWVKSHSCFTQIVGLNTNIRFLDTLAGHEAFQSGDVHTGFIGQHHDDLFRPRLLSDVTLCQAAMALVLTERDEMLRAAAASNGACDWPVAYGGEAAASNINHLFWRKFILNSLFFNRIESLVFLIAWNKL